ncbi:MAG TPA: hypothetical protein DCR14_07690 [Acidimicrobiaceae bacterium]|nr:hypothetical protein [Acidimicrobiaceae bacterium]
MTVAITIRHVPTEVRNELAARAARRGASLQEYLLGELSELAARPDRAALVARLRAELRHAPTVSTETIIAARDADRR